MRNSNCAILSVVGLLVACCAVTCLAGLMIVTAVDLPQPEQQLALDPVVIWTATRSISATLSLPATPVLLATRSASATRGPQNTRTPSARATPSPVVVKSLNYDIRVPTPEAPTTTHPVGYASSLKIVTYPVQGTSLRSISSALDANAIADPHEPNSHYYAQTVWNLNGNWRWSPTSRGCELDRGEITLQMTMTLPMLDNASSVPAEVQTRWTRFVENTITHESGHVKIALQGGHDYQRDLGNMRPLPNCDAVKSTAKDLFDDAFGAIDRANVEYDAETKHGLTQGAIFP